MGTNFEGDKDKTFQDYNLVITKGKYGITDKKGNIVIDCVFDNIEWLSEENLVKFRINDKYALCVISNIEKI